jgi:hypothetical protein
MRHRRKSNQPKLSHKISSHFSKRDFRCQCGNCKNTLKVSLGLIGGLELLREAAGGRVNIIQGYVCPDAADKSGTLKRNFHIMGLAADITINGKTAVEVFSLAEKIDEFKGIGLNITKNYVHIDTRKEEERDCWVIDQNQSIPLTEENRFKYLDQK